MLITNLPPESATVVALTEGASRWGTSDYLLALAVDALHAANWQRGGGKNGRPKRIPRPGVPDDAGDRIGGGTTYSVAEMDELLSANRDDEGGT